MPAYLLHLTELAGSLNSSDGASCIICVGAPEGSRDEEEEIVAHSLSGAWIQLFSALLTCWEGYAKLFSKITVLQFVVPQLDILAGRILLKVSSTFARTKSVHGGLAAARGKCFSQGRRSADFFPDFAICQLS